MKININFLNLFKSIDGIYPQMFMFRFYKLVKGINFRIFGLHFNIRENNATEKLIKINKEKFKYK